MMWASSLMFLHQFQAYLPLILVMRAKLNHLFCSHCLTVWKSVRCLPNTICFEKRKERNHAIFFQSPFLSLQKTIVVLSHFFFPFLYSISILFFSFFFFSLPDSHFLSHFWLFLSISLSNCLSCSCIIRSGLA